MTVRWLDVLTGKTSLDREAIRHGSLHTPAGFDPQSAPDPEDLDWQCRPAEDTQPREHEERDAA